MTTSDDKLIASLAAGQAVPLVEWVLADTETPVTAYAKLRKLGACVLFESVEGGETWGRYSIIGLAPRRTVRIDRSGQVTLDGETIGNGQDPFDTLRDLFNELDLADDPDGQWPRFLGGWVGYFGYGTIHWIEPTVPDDKEETTPFPDAIFNEIDLAVLFDNVRHTLAVVSIARPDVDVSPEQVISESRARITGVKQALAAPLELATIPVADDTESVEFAPVQSPESFKQSVRDAVQAIIEGEAIQVVLSQRFLAPLQTDPFTLYRALRLVNPSPYLFFMEFPEGALIGSSPEVLVRKDGDQAVVRPIAGTRKRGRTEARDRELEAELLADPKEIAEHVMLVDLGRNDLGRVCKAGTVQVTEQMVIERYSHVMHIVSNVEGTLADDLDALELLRACFPAGTVSGAPKVRAMQLIEELEQLRRGPYSGAIGYFDYRGDMDTGIAIRTFFAWGDTVALQAGAGIVADSDPDLEYKETLNKAGALFEAVRLVQRGFTLDPV